MPTVSGLFNIFCKKDIFLFLLLRLDFARVIISVIATSFGQTLVHIPQPLQRSGDNSSKMI